MKEENYGVTTFKSTQYALQGEEIFKEKDISFKTIPTPREITYSCGLAILFTDEDIPKVGKLVEDGILLIDGLYKYTKSGVSRKVEKIM